VACCQSRQRTSCSWGEALGEWSRRQRRCHLRRGQVIRQGNQESGGHYGTLGGCLISTGGDESRRKGWLDSGEIAVVVKGPETETSCPPLLPLFNARSIKGAEVPIPKKASSKGLQKHAGDCNSLVRCRFHEIARYTGHLSNRHSRIDVCEMRT
jgi:hypothetical protein